MSVDEPSTSPKTTSATQEDQDTRMDLSITQVLSFTSAIKATGMWQGVFRAEMTLTGDEMSVDFRPWLVQSFGCRRRRVAHP